MLYEIPFEKVAPYSKVAAKEHVSVTNTKKTRWYQWPGVGFCALIELSPARARVKGVYVFPEWRGRGLGGQMTEELFEIAGLLGYTQLEAFALNPKFYEARGWRREGSPLRSGAWKVVK